jgi:ubiquinone/menaquinone biosynthesis C-methylase UbiE
MTFNVAASAYDAFMGRYSARLVEPMADLAGVSAGQRAIDVGCGPGALTAELVRRLGADHVAAVEPSEPFFDAARGRNPGVDIRLAPAEHLPFDDDAFDLALAQLVVHFMDDPVAGLTEMRRVTRAGGVVAACVWDHAGDRGPLSLFWRAAHSIDTGTIDESRLAGARPGHLRELFERAGLRDIESGELSVSFEHESFEEWWEPYTAGVGPAGAYVARLDSRARDRLRDRCREFLPEPPFTLVSVAWSARGIA